MKSNSLKHNRNVTWKHALRKQRLSKECSDCISYDNLHQYSKNKIKKSHSDVVKVNISKMRESIDAFEQIAEFLTI